MSLQLDNYIFPHEFLDGDENSISKILFINILFLIILLFTLKKYITVTTVMTLIITLYLINKLKK